MNVNVDFGSGRKRSVIITVLPRTFYDPMQGDTELEYDRISMWADAGLADILSKVEGVLMVSVHNQIATHYSIAVDPRYDTAHVTRELEAAAVLPKEDFQTFKQIGLTNQTPYFRHDPQV